MPHTDFDLHNKLTNFQIYPKTELAGKNPTPPFKRQNSDILVEYDEGFDMKTGKLMIDAAHSY